METLDVPPSYPPPAPPKRPTRPNITLQIPETVISMTPKGATTGTSIYRGLPRLGVTPGTPASHISDPHSNPYLMHLYHNKASEFMFKQFEGFKDFTMNTAKSGLSAGEKSAFWFFNKLKLLSRKWFTHLSLCLCLCLYSFIGAIIFVALEAPNEDTQDKNLTIARQEIVSKIRKIYVNNQSLLLDDSFDILLHIEKDLEDYELNYSKAKDNNNNNDTKHKTWTFWNAMFYAGTIYTTIGYCGVGFILVVMSENVKRNELKLTLKIPAIRAESETQTVSQLVIKSSDNIKEDEMDSTQDRQAMSIRKRRNLSKNRGPARQREKTPEPGRTLIPHEDTTTSDDEDFKPQRNSREIEADNTYEEMKRLVQEQAGNKDPIYDLDTDQLKEARAVAALERRRRSISPFAIPDKEDTTSSLERKGSFTDPTNKLLSTNYTLTPKDEDNSRRNSLTIEPPKEVKNIVSTPSPSTSSPKDKDFPYPLSTTPKTLEEIIYPDDKKTEGAKKIKATKNENVFKFEDKEKKQSSKPTSPIPETPVTPGELVTKVIQVERTPSKKLLPDKKPVVEVRERVVRTPSRKLSADAKPILSKQQPPKQNKDEPQSRAPPVKPARSKSASRFASKTSESEMSEDQQINPKIEVSKRRVIPVPRRYTKNKMSPKVNRSQSLHRSDNYGEVDKTGTGMSQTSREIIELMQRARARSLSIPKDDARLPSEYKDYEKNLKTPNKTPTTLKGRTSREMSCPKTIQIISEKEILSSLLKTKQDIESPSRRSSGYIDASQSEYTSSCYSSSPSENECDFDLSERTAELTRKLNVLSLEVDRREMMTGIILGPDISDVKSSEPKSVLRKRSIADSSNGTRKESKLFSSKVEQVDKISKRKSLDKKNKKVRSRWKVIANWQQFKEEQATECEKIRVVRNKCVVNMLILIIMCGLGGITFKTLEGSFENAYKCSTRNVKRDFIEHLWRGSHHLREEDWKSMARKKLYEFESQLHTAHEAGVTSYSGQRSWNFMNSFVYCLTLVTTVGYGHIAPKTTYGRIATIVYAIIGIPLFLILLADFGKLFTRIIKFFWAFIRRFYYTRSCRKVRRTGPVQEVMKGLNIVYDVVRRPSQIFSEEDVQGDDVTEQPPKVVRKPSDVPPPLPPKPGSAVRDLDNMTEPETPAPSVFEIDDEFNLPISVAVFILLVYINIGALVYSTWEQWNFFESFYFIFISITTIGLGDFVPNHPMFMMASILYLVFGFALMSMFINVVQVKLSDTFKKASAKLGATIGLKVSDEDGSLVPITPPPIEIVPIHKPKTETTQNVETDDTKNVEIGFNDTNNR